MKKYAMILIFLAAALQCRADTLFDNTDSDFYGGSLNAVSVAGAGAAAGVKLHSTMTKIPGNTFIISGGQDFIINSMGYRLSLPFSAPANITVTAVILFGTWEGSTGSYNIGIRADTGGGLSPDQSGWLAPGNFNAVNNLLSGGEAYYFPVTFASDAILNSGTPYHIYIEPSSGVDASNYLSPHSVSPDNLFYPAEGAPDPYAQVLQSINSGVSWTANTDSPVFILEYLDPTGAYTDSHGRPVSYIGNPYYSYQDRLIYGPNCAGQEFDISTSTALTGISIYADAGGGPPADNLNVVIKDITNPLNELIIDNELFVAKTHVFPGITWVSNPLISSIALSAGHRYRIFFQSPLSTVSGYYIVRGTYVFRNASQAAIFGEDRLASATYGAASSNLVYSTSAGTSWDAVNKTQDLLITLADSLTEVFDPAGVFISRVFDTKGRSTFTRISWLPVSQTAQAGPNPVMFQAAASNDGLTWDFLGPDGTSGSWFTDPANALLPGNFGNKRYVRYKAALSTADTTLSPFIDEVSLDYTTRPDSSGDIKLTNFPNPFNPDLEKTGIRYTLFADSAVSISIYSPLLELVKKMEIDKGAEGGRGAAGGYDNTVMWDGKNGAGMTVESGIYICSVEVKEGGQTYRRKIAVLK